MMWFWNVTFLLWVSGPSSIRWAWWLNQCLLYFFFFFFFGNTGAFENYDSFESAPQYFVCIFSFPTSLRTKCKLHVKISGLDAIKAPALSLRNGVGFVSYNHQCAFKQIMSLLSQCYKVGINTLKIFLSEFTVREESNTPPKENLSQIHSFYKQSSLFFRLFSQTYHSVSPQLLL